MQLDASDLDGLRPLIALAVRETIREIEGEHARLDGRLGYTEREAAALLGLPQHVLRDCRLRGEIQARKAGKRFIYSRDEILRFLAATEGQP